MSRRGTKFEIRQSYIESLRLKHANTEREVLRRVTLEVEIINFRVVRASRMIQHKQRFCVIQAHARSARIAAELAALKEEQENIRVAKIRAEERRVKAIEKRLKRP